MENNQNDSLTNTPISTNQAKKKKLGCKAYAVIFGVGFILFSICGGITARFSGNSNSTNETRKETTSSSQLQQTSTPSPEPTEDNSKEIESFASKYCDRRKNLKTVSFPIITKDSKLNGYKKGNELTIEDCKGIIESFYANKSELDALQ